MAAEVPVNLIFEMAAEVYYGPFVLIENGKKKDIVRTPWHACCFIAAVVQEDQKWLRTNGICVQPIEWLCRQQPS